MKKLTLFGIGLGALGMYFGVKEAANRYLDKMLQERGKYPAPEGFNVFQKAQLVRKAPFNY